jgi:ApaG protein
MYETTTRHIRIRATAQFLAERSDPSDDQFFWTYSIEIMNEGRVRVQLKSRYWQITDESGRVETVRGPGVVGETPTIEPGASFSYTSGCPLTTPSGVMVGHYTMVTDAGVAFEAAIPAFSLDSPHGRRAVH